MKLRKLNAYLSLLATLLIFQHFLYCAVYMLFGVGLPFYISPFFAMAIALVHGFLSLALAVLAHKDSTAKGKGYKSYPFLMRATLIQRMTAIFMLILLPFHIMGANTNFKPLVLHAVIQPVFYFIVALHIAVSLSKAFITLGVGSVKAVKIIDIASAIVCAALFLMATAGLYLGF